MPNRILPPDADAPGGGACESKGEAVTTCLGRLWGRGYFVASSGNVTDETLAEYIRLQGAAPQDGDRFQVSEE